MLRADGPARCAAFHQVNQNLALVGTAAGDVAADNHNIGKATQARPGSPRGPALHCRARGRRGLASLVRATGGHAVASFRDMGPLYDALWLFGVMQTGQMVYRRPQDRARLPGGGAATALAATPTLLFVADARGHVHTLRCEIRAGALHGLVHLARRRAPGGGWCQRRPHAQTEGVHADMVCMVPQALATGCHDAMLLQNVEALGAACRSAYPGTVITSLGLARQ